MTRILAALLLAAAAPLAAQESPVPDQPAPAPEAPPVYIPLTAQERWDDYVKRSFSLGAVTGRGARIGITNLWSNNPPEWGSGVEGYGKRFVSDFSRAWMRRGMESAGAYALGQDPRYIRCPCKNVFKRVGHAMSQAVLTYDNDGNRVFGTARVGSRYAAAMIETTWFPDRYSWKDGFREGSQSFIGVGLFNVVREFWPDIRGKLRRKKD